MLQMRRDWVKKLTLYTNPSPDGNYTINKYKIIRKKHEKSEKKP